MPSSEPVQRAFKGYLCNVLFFSVAILLYRNNAYYENLLSPFAQQTLLFLYFAYLVFGAFSVFLFPENERKGLIAMQGIAAGYRSILRRLRETETSPTPRSLVTHEQRTAILFLIVKLFFVPIMINFAFHNYENLMKGMHNLDSFENTHDILLDGWFGILISAIFLVDTLYFCFGYLVEHAWLRNTVRSVEPTLLGWIVALLCYPPFNDVPGYYVGWVSDDYAAFDSLPLTYALRAAVLLSLFVYVWATVALGAKCSNLTNRGIVSHGPYAFVRHPAYVSKNLAWLLTALPFVFSTGSVGIAALSLGVWTTLYALRAMTEERHLSADPAYRNYCARVRWRFIPYIF